MYQSEFRPEFGHEPAALQPNEEWASLFDRRSLGSAVSFLLSFVSTNRLIRGGALALLIGSVVTALSGCGGITLNTSLSMISCGTQSLTGAQSVACTLTLSTPAPGATTVSLTSSNAALSVPASVMFAAGAKTAAFTAVSQAVSQPVSVTITGNAGTVSKAAVITLYPAAASGPTLSQVSCGTQTLIGPTTEACSVSLSAATTSQVVVTLSSSSSALQVPASVNVAAGATSAGFNATASAVSAAQTVTLTATAAGVSQTDVIQLALAGSTPHQVQLSWDAPPATSVAIVGYNVYRTTAGGSNYGLLSSSIDTQTNFLDATVQSGVTYDYVVKSVDSSGAESAPSNATEVTIP